MIRAGLLLFTYIFFYQKRWFKASLFTAFTIFSMVFARSFSKLFHSLGGDSFQETTKFDVWEAVFYASTIIASLKPSFRISDVLASIIPAIGVICALTLAEKRLSTLITYRSKLYLCSVIVTCGFLAQTGSFFRSYSEATSAYQEIQANFGGIDTPKLSIVADPVTVFVYIGESTSAMNMQLYGYPRSNNPNLMRIQKSDSNLLVFNNVFSTHTHTSPSLLEALSLSAHEQTHFVPITEQRRLSIVDLLQSVGIRTVLYSNQSSTGTWNQASSIIFRNAERHFSLANALLGNFDANRPYDNTYLATAMADPVFAHDQRSLIIFHSYAGHGPYSKNVPREITTPNWLVTVKTPSALMGKIKKIRDVDAYDTALSFVDQNISNAINFVKQQNKPIVFIYFSDHGDSVFSGRGHDSSRFIFEMARVPFLVYFNDHAKTQRRHLFELLRDLANKQHTATLAQVPNTILALLGVAVEHGNKVDLTPIVGSRWKPDPILVRRVNGAIKFVDLGDADFRSIHKTEDRATQNHILSSHLAADVCYHRSNSIVKALRGSMTSSCIEFDVVVSEDVLVHHPPQESTGLTLDDLLSLATLKEKLIWVDAKNIDAPEKCMYLLSKLRMKRDRFKGAIVEFPPSAIKQQGLIQCSAGLRSLGLATSHYVSTEIAVDCAKHLDRGHFDSSDACLKLTKEISDVQASNNFSDISFDIQAFSAIKKIPATRGFRWNTWNVDPAKISDFMRMVGDRDLGRFRAIIPKNNDPNDI
jgi:glucan phosphoethanolaminetransferase (alkaline phosphatase superfamily)